MQFDLYIDPEVLEYVKVVEGDVSGINEGNFGDRFLNEGRLSFAWFDASGLGYNIDENTVLFKLVFKVKQEATRISDYLDIISHKNSSFAFEPNGKARKVNGIFESITPTNQSGLEYGLLSQPNPFTSATEVQITLPKEERGSIIVYDISGKAVLRQETVFRKGINIFTIKATDLPARGLYYLQVQTEGFSQTRKIVIQ